MIVKILLAVFFAIAAVIGYAAFQTPDYSISRTVVIKASPETLFPFINSAEKSYSWMPWQDMDPDVKMNYAGPSEGVGSVGSWTSEGQMGIGKSTIIESVPYQFTKIQIAYQKPFVMEQLAEMSLLPVADGTAVKWSVTGKNNLIGRVFCLFMNMDKMVGGNFELGLNKLKTKIENK